MEGAAPPDYERIADGARFRVVAADYGSDVLKLSGVPGGEVVTVSGLELLQNYRRLSKEKQNMLALETIAKVCHEANRAYCRALGDNSQLAWEDAPGWQRESAVNGVKHALANPDAKPSDSHESWLAEKRAAGWKYGPVKDPERKEHPCFVPYEQLPAEQKAKDFIFLAIARTLGAKRGGE